MVTVVLYRCSVLLLIQHFFNTQFMQKLIPASFCYIDLHNDLLNPFYADPRTEINYKKWVICFLSGPTHQSPAFHPKPLFFFFICCLRPTNQDLSSPNDVRRHTTLSQLLVLSPANQLRRLPRAPSGHCNQNHHADRGECQVIRRCRQCNGEEAALEGKGVPWHFGQQLRER